MKEEILEVRAIFSNYFYSSNLAVPYVSKTTIPNLVLLAHQQHGNNPAVIAKKFRPKIDPLKLKSCSLKYASVIITKAIQPGEIYVRFDDEDVPRYEEMQRDLQKEFNSATRLSASYSPSPIPGLF